MHWPLILNVPGEGFGDDFLQHYANHASLTEADDDLFLLDEAFEASGGSCPRMGGGGGGGPPALEEPVPSNLEIDENAWFSNEYTFSPVWEPRTHSAMDSSNYASSDIGITEAGIALVESCYDSSSSSVELSVTFRDVVNDEGELPWVALGYREDEECLMIPRSGADSDMILVTTDTGSVPVASFGPLLSSVRNFDPAAMNELSEGLTPLATTDDFSDVEVSFSEATAVARSAEASTDSVLKLHFKQTMNSEPEVMHLMYAVGLTQQMGYHSTRECFEVTQFPPCVDENAVGELAKSEGGSMDAVAEEIVGGVASLENETSTASLSRLFYSSISLAIFTAVSTLMS